MNIPFSTPSKIYMIATQVEDHYLAPCMLRQESPRAVINPEEDTRTVSTPDLRVVFKGKFLPTPVFHRLLAACVSRWPVAKEKETSKNLIFCCCCVFDLDLFHRLTLHFKNHVVFARITRMGMDEVKIPDAKLCSRVRRFITLNIGKITSYLGQNLQPELRVPFSMWLSDDALDPDAPITPEHMYHARLNVALATVCGRAMRGILLTNIPVRYSDIYQAIMGNRGILIGRQGKALLNSMQIRLVFPDPFGRKKGTVDQFDISLLYVLIRNISSVSAPMTGWGYDPQNQPKDSSLGASVERIRSYRNNISGHSPNGRLCRLEYDSYWNMFEAVLHDIEAVTGRQVYIPELEKQNGQVISIYEAC
ncbi:hypothetical protein CHS0354_019562 [Potamilus streckersoni]|uniref:DZIP3-like HEPN domain-containing protein n=1 Tax=Potamilus streckersoni TaxID=2493646 RepID=A0AAE0TG15_9BIVA|nr:hypothetical protein CHS0354_019562 [Potamilus streckersoni]